MALERGPLFERLTRLAFAVGLALAMTTSAAPRVSADCDGPYPSFRNAASTAKQLVIGDVVAVQPGGSWDPATGGASSRFSLQVAFVLRGTAPVTMQIQDLPTQPCAGVIAVRLGDRIVLALDGRDFAPPVAVNMVAWIDRPPPEEMGIDPADGTLTLDEALGLVGLRAATPAPEVPTSPSDAGTTPVQGILVALLLTAVGVVAVILVWRRRSRTGVR